MGWIDEVMLREIPSLNAVDIPAPQCFMVESSPRGAPHCRSPAGHGDRRLSHSTVGWQWELVLIALAWLPLTVRNRWPVLVLVVVAAVDAISIGVAGYAHPPACVVPVSTMLALYTVSVRFAARRAWSIAAVIGTLQFVVALTTRLALTRDFLYLNWVVVAAVAGQLVRERRAKLAAADQRAVAAERSKEAEAPRRVIEERMRIAHELHDVLAHHIAVVNAQAGVAQYLLETDPTAAVRRCAVSRRTVGPPSTSCE